VRGLDVGVLAVVRNVLQTLQELEFDSAWEFPRGRFEQLAVAGALAQAAADGDDAHR
jgi:hypothetical protein